MNIIEKIKKIFNKNKIKLLQSENGLQVPKAYDLTNETATELIQRVLTPMEALQINLDLGKEEIKKANRRI